MQKTQGNAVVAYSAAVIDLSDKHFFSPRITMPAIFHVLHLVFLFLLFGLSFSALADPRPERRKKMLMYSGISSLVVFLAGFALLGYLSIGFPGWIIVKLICWLVLSALAGLAFRLRESTEKLQAIAIACVLIAVTMVYFRPF
jgi:hypothetical protein